MSGLFLGCYKSTPEIQIKEVLSLAKAGGNKKWKKACRKLENCIKRGVTGSNLINLYVLSLDQAGNRPRAITVALQSLKQNPNDFLLNYFLGKMYCYDREFRTAIRYLGKCHNLRPKHIDTIILMLQCAEELNPTFALNLYLHLKTMKTFGNSYLLHNGLAVCYVQKGELFQAMSEFSTALKLSNGHPVVHLNMAILCDRYMNKPQIAKRHYLNYLEKSGNKFPEKSKKIAKRLESIIEK